MARRSRSAQLETRTARLKLRIAKKPVFVTVGRGVGLGYRRNRGPGTWVVRATDGHCGVWTKGFGIADDHEEADGERILTFWQAQDRARALARGTLEGNSDRPITVDEAVIRYETDLLARDAALVNASRIRKHLPSVLASKAVSLVGARELRLWRNGLVKKGLRPASADRTARMLKAALNLAARDDPQRITNTAAWRTGLARLPDSEESRNVVLPDDTVRDLVAGAYEFGRDFGLFVETAAVTGARTSQLLRIEVVDLQDNNDGPRLMVPNSRKGRRRRFERKPVPIPQALAMALRQATVGRPGDAPLLSFTGRPGTIFERLVARLELDPSVTLYALRHSSITRQLLAGVPTRLVASLHDTSVEQIEKTYSRYIADHGDALVRRTLLEVGPRSPTTNVVPLKVTT